MDLGNEERGDPGTRADPIGARPRTDDHVTDLGTPGTLANPIGARKRAIQQQEKELRDPGTHAGTIGARKKQVTDNGTKAMERSRIQMKLEFWFKILRGLYPAAHSDDYFVDDPKEAMERLMMDIEIIRHYRRVCFKLARCTPAEGMAVTDNGTAGPSRRDQGKGNSTSGA